MPEAPRPSPRPEYPPELPNEPGTDPAIRAVKATMRNELNWQGAKLTIATAVVAIGTAFGAYRFMLSEAAAQTDAGITPIAKRVDTLEQQQKHLSDDVHEVQGDIRALYKAVMTGRPQERLERPLPAADGGRQ